MHEVTAFAELSLKIEELKLGSHLHLGSSLSNPALCLSYMNTARNFCDANNCIHSDKLSPHNKQAITLLALPC